MFVNIKKVNLEETDDPIIAMANSILVFASIIHDCVVDKKDYESAKQQLELLNSCVCTTYRFLDKSE